MVLFTFFIFNCSPKKRTITFTNESNTNIDSLEISVSSADVYSEGYHSIKPFETVMLTIPRNRPKSNHHDFTISITVFIKDNVIHKSYHNDLSGYLNRDYSVMLNKEDELEWK